MVSRQGAVPQSHVSFRSAGTESAAPDTGQGGVVDIKLKINRLSGLTAPTAETTHRVAREPQKKQSFLRRSFLAGLLASQRVLHAARINCGTLERRSVVASCYPKSQCGGLDRRRLLSDQHPHR